MKYHSLLICFIYALLVSCSIQEAEVTTPKNTEEPEFYASIEGSSTRVYVDEDLNVLWNAEDQVSIFNKNTYNQPYKFLGNTGDNAGGFNKVDVAEFVTGKPITNIVSVYPYQEDTQISESGVLTVTLPKEQTYSEKTFGMGTNTMVSVSTDNYLQFKNVGGYLKLRMYGEGVSISTIILKGNNNEKLSGKAYITMPLEGTPSVEMASDAETEVILNSKNSVLLGSTAENCTDFWFVLPPVTFSKGFTIIVKRKDGQAFTKTASSPVTITRNNLLNMAPFEVKMEGTQPNNVIYYTTSDSTTITPKNGFGAKLVSNYYIDGLGILTFDGDVTAIAPEGFENCSNLTTVTIPQTVIWIREYAFRGCTGLKDIRIRDSVTSLGSYCFYGCSSLSSIEIPESVTSIGAYCFYGCSSLSSIVIPESVNSIGESSFSSCNNLFDISIPNNVSIIGKRAFSGCKLLESISLPSSINSIANEVFIGCISLSSIIIPDNVTSIGDYSFSGCTNLASITIPTSVQLLGKGAFKNCEMLTSVVLSEGLMRIEEQAFYSCSSLSSITIPESVSRIGGSAFYNCDALTRIDVKPINPPTGGSKMFHNTSLCPIYIPSGSEEAYTHANYWRQYSLRMRIDGSDSPVIYSSTDYSHDGEVIELQKASVGLGINIILMGDGFLDKDMATNGKYEQEMKKAMEQFFAYEPYTTFRNRFNVYAVKVISENDLFGDEGYVRRLTYEENGILYFRTSHCYNYATAIPNPNKQPRKIAVLFNTTETIGRSFCALNYNGSACCFILDPIQNVINHELGGHAFGLLMDEYVEGKDEFTEYNTLDNEYRNYGFGANIDWRSNPEEVRWSRLLKDPRYQYEGLGVFEGGYLYAKGIFRSTENSIMRTHYIDTGRSFNAPSREQIYKMIMKYSEGEEWVYDYEEFAKADEHGRLVAAEVLGPWAASTTSTRSSAREDNHHPPVYIDDSVKEVGMDKNGNIVSIKR